MDAASPTSAAPAGPHAAWEAAFAPSVVASSRRLAGGGWTGGDLFVVDAPPSDGYVRLEPMPSHAVLAFTGRRSRADERGPGRPPHLHGPVGRGDVLVYPPDLHGGPHETRWEGRTQFLALLLPPRAVADASRALDLDYGGLEFLPHLGGEDALLTALLTALRREVTPSARDPSYADELLHTVAVHLAARHTARPVGVRTLRGGLTPLQLRRADEHARAHLADPLSVGDLAAEAGLSRWHFSRSFRVSTGETVVGYLQRLRIERATELLRGGTMPLAAVAYEVGYQSLSHFSAVFRRHCGVAPGAFRRGRG